MFFNLTQNFRLFSTPFIIFCGQKTLGQCGRLFSSPTSHTGAPSDHVQATVQAGLPRPWMRFSFPHALFRSG
jgi:hypothetical protein